MARTFLKKNYPKKKVSGQKQRCIQTLAVSKETQQSSKFTQQESIFLKKRKNLGHTRLFTVNPRMYANIVVKAACIRNRELKTRVQEEKCIKRKANR